ncbi:transmembrane protein 94-like isoform X1 [Pocillopora damicornis]|uniref:transmembrane protein 94-like isoform X1 n=1 Tax=Pocillopora damicornis TaxID=46731 RepID=UPI000F55982C|nr:transmembrane protein 94-like isoform X1 [Pocillopora damicornis]
MKMSDYPKDSSAASEKRRSWSWRRREGLGESEGEIDLDTLEILCEVQEKTEEGSLGLSSQEALKRLFDAIHDELATFRAVNQCTWRSDLWSTLSDNHHLPISFISLAFLVFEFLVMVMSYAISDKTRSLPLIEGIIVLLLTAVNLILCVREERLRRTEMIRSTQELLNSCNACCSWMPSDYVDPCTPPSLSISLAHAYRDNELVSVPVNLLVQGDVVVLGPGHTAPAQVQQLPSEFTNRGPLFVLEEGQVYHPVTQSGSSDGNRGTGVQPSQPHPREKFLVTESPFKQNLRTILNNSLKRPISIIGNEMHYITSTIIDKKLLFTILVLSLTVNILRTIFLKSESGHWSEMILLLQGYTILPLLPISFPVVWICLNLYGTARIQVLFTQLKEKEDPANEISLKEVLCCFWKNFLGDPSSLPRTTSLLEILGSVTVWCCVDKEGILSLPNPCAEKVFFLKSKKHRTKEESAGQAKERKESVCTWESEISRVSSSQDGQESSDEEDDDDVSASVEDSESVEKNRNHCLRGHREVLNLSSDPESQFGLRFDDIRWQNHINSLKPLGLNILLNSCCKSPVRCLRFADHTGLLSLSYNSVPLPFFRRCLCLLGKEIGFMERALQLFSKQKYIFAVQSPINSTLRVPIHSHSFLSISKERPIPTMVCLITKENNSGSLQLLTQGSADIVLDACTDYWDGSSLCPVTAFERKKVLDFYQRNSMSAYCVAFSYRPVTEQIPDEKSEDVYLELPSTTQWICNESDEMESASEISEAESENSDMDSAFNCIELLETDVEAASLLERVNIAENAESYQRILGGQVFIGVVTLQFQAKKDILPLIEDLDNAGIRFVYFSAENELRSRVFAERMGLETGWNCHISLREGGHLLDDRGSSATVSDRNTESLYDIQDDANVSGQDGDEKHVSWKRVHTESAEKISNKVEAIEMDPLLESQSDGGTLLGSSQISAPEDYWFFSNRAKLPRGIQNIRPHLESVDNVPLLVPLFTDCTPSAVKEMIAIMQDYGEVVCCVGSSFNSANPAIFIQADIGIAVEPLFPQLCLKGLPKDFRSGTPQLGQENTREKLRRRFSDEQSIEVENELSPLELSAFLNALPCSLAFHRDASFKFLNLIKEARRICFGLKNCFSFMLSCQLVLSAMMLLSSCVLLPPPLTGLHLLWLSCLIVPLLSLSLIGSPSDPNLMTMMTGKNDKNFKEITHTVCFFFSVCFFPSLCICCLILFPLNLRGICFSLNKKSSNCHYLLGFRNTAELWNGLGESHIQALAMAQDINVFFLVLIFVFMSSSYVHRLHLLWRKSPFMNRSWIISAVVILILQVIYFTLSQVGWSRHAPLVFHLTDVPVPSMIIIFLWPIVALAICELLKRRYIKESVRFQRRAKLKFGTKLGMNSPF